jgi:hypothetical protein
MIYKIMLILKNQVNPVKKIFLPIIQRVCGKGRNRLIPESFL